MALATHRTLSERTFLFVAAMRALVSAAAQSAFTCPPCARTPSAAVHALSSTLYAMPVPTRAPDAPTRAPDAPMRAPNAPMLHPCTAPHPTEIRRFASAMPHYSCTHAPVCYITPPHIQPCNACATAALRCTSALSFGAYFSVGAYLVPGHQLHLCSLKSQNSFYLLLFYLFDPNKLI